MNVEQSIRKKLSGVIDPGAGLDVERMGLVRKVEVDGGRVTVVLRPTSPVCPMAFKLAADISEAVRSVAGVNSVAIKVENFERAAELEALFEE